MKLLLLEDENGQQVIAPAKYFKRMSAQNTYDDYGQRLGREYGLGNTVKAHNFHDGHNFQTVTIDSEHGTPTHKCINESDPDLAKKTLRHYRQAKKNGWRKSSPGISVCETTRFSFHESAWQGSWELAAVSLGRYTVPLHID